MFWMKAAAERGLRYSYCITSGNEPDLGLADYLNFVIDDPQTRQVVLFIEGIRRPDAFMHAAGRALAMGKPILAIKTGATEKSQAASQSHTGAIAGDYAAYLAMCERYGIVNFRSLDDLVEAALAFDGGRLPKGPRIGFVTTSGGTVDLLYDYAEAEGAAMPDFTDETKAALLPMMQDGIAPKNPLDVGIPSTIEVAARICETAARDPQYRHGGLGLAHAAQGGRLGRRDAVAAAPEQDRQADRRVRPHDLPGERQPPRRAGGGRLPLPAGDRADHPRAQRLVVSRRAPRPPAADATARAAAATFRRTTLEAALARYGIALPKSAGRRQRRRSRGRGRAHRLPGGAENSLARHPAQDRGRRRGARPARPRGGAGSRGRARRVGARDAARRAHRRLPRAGDGIRRRGHRRRAQRSALRSDAAGRRRRRAGRAGQGRGVAPAAGRPRTRSAP